MACSGKGWLLGSLLAQLPFGEEETFVGREWPSALPTNAHKGQEAPLHPNPHPYTPLAKGTRRPAAFSATLGAKV